MTIKKYTFLSIFSFCMLLFYSDLQAQDPEPVAGVWDLRKHDFTAEPLLSGHGEWHFFPSRLIHAPADENGSKPTVSEIPSEWNGLHSEGDTMTGMGFGTYKLEILLPPNCPDLFIHVGDLGTSLEVYSEGKLLGASGRVSETKDGSEPSYRRTETRLDRPGERLIVYFCISNYDYRKGGLWHGMDFGTEKAVRASHEHHLLIEVFLAGSILVMGLYHLGFYFMRRDQPSALYFAFACLLLTLRTATTGELFIYELEFFEWADIVRLEYLSFVLSAIALLFYIRELFPTYLHRIPFWFFVCMYGSAVPVVVFTRPYIFSHTMVYVQPLAALSVFWITYGLFRSLLKKEAGIYAFFAAFIFFGVASINDILYSVLIINTGDYFSFGIFSFILIQAMLISFRFSQAYTEARELTEELNETNQKLETMVDDRTVDLRETIRELDKTNLKINKQSEKIKDSIQYAGNIQQAVLPLKEDFDRLFPEHFTLFRPRDIVSGDFYLLAEKDGKVIFCVADCTGHGVPGGFMSMLGQALLAQIILQKGITNPGKILSEADRSMNATLQHEKTKIRDGMDVCLCVWSPAESVLEFAGAGIGLFVASAGNLEVIPRSKYSVGGLSKHEKEFTTVRLEIKEKTWLYLSSDGYRDQFGGPADRKFLSRRMRSLLLEIIDLPSEGQRKKVVETLDEWQQTGDKEREQTDDILVQGICLLPA